jgi:hypothetical protein
MRKFWKLSSIVLFTICVAFMLTGLSMFWWPNIPSSPRPSEGRVYPLNNHGHYTYMNDSERFIHQLTLEGSPILLVAFAAIQYFVDPFDYKRRRRIYASPPAGFR